VTMQLPEEDRYAYTKDYLVNQIAILFGGRVAEELFMNQMTTGASNDFERATDLARKIVTRWGMTTEMGPVIYGENESEVFLGRSVTSTKHVSEATMQKIDETVRNILETQYALVRKLLDENRDKVEVMARMLLERETIDATEIQAIMNPVVATESV
ncbi:MAG: cell division protein FtsH, partial [Proteobacteria bacterium]